MSERIKLLDRYVLDGPSHGYTETSHCGPSYQEKVLERFVKHLKQRFPKSPLRVLDLASGLGEAADFFDNRQHHISSVRLDISEIALGLQNGARVRALATELPFKDESFHGIHFKDALVHIDDKTKLFKETWRVLKPGGYMVVASKVIPMGGFAVHEEEKNENLKNRWDVFIDSEENYLSLSKFFEGFGSLITIDPPYYETHQKSTVSSARKGGLWFLNSKSFSWRPAEDQPDWHTNGPADRFVVFLSKPTVK